MQPAVIRHTDLPSHHPFSELRNLDRSCQGEGGREREREGGEGGKQGREGGRDGGREAGEGGREGERE